MHWLRFLPAAFHGVRIPEEAFTVSNLPMWKTIVATAALSFVAAAPAAGQISRLWSFEDLMNEADLVVIAARVATRDTDYRTTLGASFPVVELRTEFNVAVVLKGWPVSGRVILRHYRWDEERLGAGGVINGPHALAFSKGDDAGSDYLLFLAQQVDGTFEPVSGQVVPEDSVLSLHPAR